MHCNPRPRLKHHAPEAVPGVVLRDRHPATSPHRHLDTPAHPRPPATVSPSMALLSALRPLTRTRRPRAASGPWPSSTTASWGERRDTCTTPWAGMQRDRPVDWGRGFTKGAGRYGVPARTLRCHAGRANAFAVVVPAPHTMPYGHHQSLHHAPRRPRRCWPSTRAECHARAPLPRTRSSSPLVSPSSTSCCDRCAG